MSLGKLDKENAEKALVQWREIYKLLTLRIIRKKNKQIKTTSRGENIRKREIKVACS